MDQNATPPDSPSPSVTELGQSVRTAISRVHRRFRSQRPIGDLGDSALEVLVALEKDGPMSLTELSARQQVKPASMSQTVNRLSEGGYIVRSADPDDRRRVLLATTPEAAAIVQSSRARGTARLDDRLKALTDEQRAVLARAAEILQAVADD
jgi:DNA-binding MarR family transcriptional regulator